MEPLEESHKLMACCGQEIEPELKIVEGFVFADWNCTLCGAVSSQEVGEIDLEEVEDIKKGSPFSMN